MDKIIVIDFGGQYTHLIASKIRGLKVYSEIKNPEVSLEEIKGAKGIILSGSPWRISQDSPGINLEIYKLGIPILGICYGHQLIARDLEGKIGEAEKKEFGKTLLEVKDDKGILSGLRQEEIVWMSHNDEVKKAPGGFKITASTQNCLIAVMEDQKRKIFSFQFHPEVTHTLCGTKIFQNSVKICVCKRNWTMQNFIKQVLEEIEERVGDRKVFLLVSGGVDSMVTFALLCRALGPEKVLGIHVNTGLERKNESQQVKESFSKLGFKNLYFRDASDLFLGKLKKVVDPEQKRNIIGELFIQVLNEKIASLGLDPEEWLVSQGTIYPDTIETARTRHADRIKTHHNRILAVQELIKRGALIEPLEQLYKDEVREVGKKLGLPQWLLWRHPFPGPGLAVRIICSNEIWCRENFPPEITDAEKEIQKIAKKFGYQAWILPIKTVGVQGDQRTYAQPVILKGAADWQALEETSIEMTNLFKGIINRVWYLISSPPVSLEHLKLYQSYLTPKRIKLVQEADYLVQKEIRKAGFERKVWQIPVVLLPLGFAPYQESLLLRPVDSENAMTAEFAKLPWPVVKKITTKLLKLEGIGQVFYDLTNKPPGTIELE